MIDVEDIVSGTVITGVSLSAAVSAVGCATHSYASFVGTSFDYCPLGGIVFGILSLASLGIAVGAGYQAVDTFKNGF